MALPQITTTRNQGGLGRPLTSLDHVSGIVFFAADTILSDGGTPVFSDIASTARSKKFFSLEEAETEGFAKDSATGADGGTSTTGLAVGIMHYHISEFFRLQPEGELWVRVSDSEIATTALRSAEVTALQNDAEGRCRQVAVCDMGTAFTTAYVGELQTEVTALQAVYRPLNVMLAADYTAEGVALASMDNCSGLTAQNVSVVVGEDGGGQGQSLRNDNTINPSNEPITCIGTALGAVSLASVHESIIWRTKFNVGSGTELSTPALADNNASNEATLNKDVALAALTALEDKAVIFLMKDDDGPGTYFASSRTCVASSSDYATIENNRTIDKAVRNVRTRLLPKIGESLYLKSDGTLTEITIATFQNEALAALQNMADEGELSGVDENTGVLPRTSVVINPAQDVLSTGQLEITIKMIPVGVAHTIAVNIGFTTNL